MIAMRIVAVCTVLATCSCSFALVDGPRSAPNPPEPCTDSYVMPTIDGVITGLALIGFIYAMGTLRAAEPGDDRGGPLVGGVFAGSLVIIFAPSALQGRSKVKRCRQAKAYSSAAAAPALSPPP
jgi:hypothetical protein